MTKPLYLFDLDGTLADLTHRLHYIDHPMRPKDWDGFFKACVHDKPITPVIDLLNSLSTHTMNPAEIWIVSGRSSVVRAETEQWLDKHVGWVPTLYMRSAGDRRPDDVIKEQMFKSWPSQDIARIQMVFDDRDRVVAMWRRNGLKCAQVAQGEF